MTVFTIVLNTLCTGDIIRTVFGSRTPSLGIGWQFCLLPNKTAQEHVTNYVILKVVQLLSTVLVIYKAEEHKTLKGNGGIHNQFTEYCRYVLFCTGICKGRGYQPERTMTFIFA